MKRIGMLALGLAIGLGLTSCYFNDFRSGSLSLDFSAIQARQVGDVARVYLLADGLLFSTGAGTPFAAEVPAYPAVGAKVRIDGLPVGPTYKALVGLWLAGTAGPTSDYCGESALFKINPGQDTSVEVFLKPTPFFGKIGFSKDLMGKNIKTVGNNFSGMIAAEETRLHYTRLEQNLSPPYEYLISTLSGYDLTADPSSRGVSGLRVNGLSSGGVGTVSTWLNTNKGIFPFTLDTWLFQMDFNSTLSGPLDILQSGTALVVQDYALFFRRTGGLGGTYAPLGFWNTPSSWTWVNLDAPGLTDMALGGGSAFFASSSGAFALPPAFLTDPTPTLAAHQVSFSASAPILSLAVRPGAGSPIGLLYMGTTDGVWSESVDESNLTFGVTTALSQIPETAGEPIDQIALCTTPTYGSNEAYLSRYWLFIKKGSGIVYKIPFYAIFPGKPTGIAWDTGGNLYVSGTEGLAAVQVGS